MNVNMFLPLLVYALILLSCSATNNHNSNNEPSPASGDTVTMWITKADATVLLQKQPTFMFKGSSNANSTITVDDATAYQTVDGFGYSLTGGSAEAINTLDATSKSNLLQELFGNGSNSVSVSYLRISIGASDLNAEAFSYDDMPAGQTDEKLEHFSLDKDKKDVIPLLKQILAINPNIKILGSPWSPPVWMKDNGSSIGGSLKPEYYSVYAQYFIKYIQAMKAEGITVDAITPQNEPLHPGNNPSLLMPAEAERDFIKNALGPAFKAAGINTKIIVYDHNCDRPDYPTTILKDADAAKFVDGSAFHLYAGDVTALSTLHNSFPDKHVYFTEQWTGSKENFGDNLMWHTKNVIIGTMNNWSRIALEWNLASDANYQPHTDGGCTECKGALTISGGKITRNESYYIIAQASKFVPAGAVRIASSAVTGLNNVAFKTADGKKVLLVLNDGTSPVNFNIKFKDKTATTSLPARSVATYSW